MNYKKISQTLLDLGYIDDRRLLCHSNANVAETRNYGVFMKVTSTYQGNLPRFMILSIMINFIFLLQKHLVALKLIMHLLNYLKSTLSIIR